MTGIKRISEFISRPEIPARHVIEDGGESTMPQGEARSGYCRVYAAPSDAAEPVVVIEGAELDWARELSEEEVAAKAKADAKKATADAKKQAKAAKAAGASGADSDAVAPLLADDVLTDAAAEVDAAAEGGAEGAAGGGAASAPDATEQHKAGGVRDITLTIPRGAFVCIVGKVGSGKSTLLHSLINEVPIKSGYVQVRAANVAYCAQEAWVQTCSVRENILFGRAFDEQRYKNALTAACLWKDLEQLRDGDDTEVGERGFTLSGGQQQRIAFARAVYAGADLYVLDDVRGDPRRTYYRYTYFVHIIRFSHTL